MRQVHLRGAQGSYTDLKGKFSFLPLSYTRTPTGPFRERYPGKSSWIHTCLFSAWCKEVLQVNVCATNWHVSLMAAMYPYNLENTAFLYLVLTWYRSTEQEVLKDCKVKPSAWCLQRSFQLFGCETPGLEFCSVKGQVNHCPVPPTPWNSVLSSKLTADRSLQAFSTKLAALQCFQGAGTAVKQAACFVPVLPSDAEGKLPFLS